MVGGRLFTTVSQKMRQAPVTTSYENDAETFFVTNLINHQGSGLQKIQSSPVKAPIRRLQSDLINNDDPDAFNEVELNDLSDKHLYQEERQEMQGILRKWCKPIYEVPVSTTNYILSQKINNSLKRSAVMEQELQQAQAELIKKEQRLTTKKDFFDS